MLRLPVQAAVAIAASIPVLLSPLVPGLDVPWHTLFAAAVHDGGGHRFLDYLQVDFQLATYATVYALIDVLSHLMSPARAMQVMSAFYVVAWVFACSHFLGAFGRDRRLAIALAPVAYSTVFLYGFVAFAAALPLLLWQWTCVRRYLVEGRRRWLACAVVLTLLVGITHSFAAGLALFGSLAIALLHPSVKRGLAVAAVLVVATVPTALSLVSMGVNDASGLPDFIRNASWWERLTAQPLSSLRESLGDIPQGLVAYAPSWLVLGVAVVVVALLVLAGAGGRPTPRPPERRILAWLLLLFAIGYFMTPYSLDWPRTMVAAQPRWLPLIAVFGMAAVAPARVTRRQLKVAAAVSSLLLIAIAFDFASFGREARDFLYVIDGSAARQRTLALVEQAPVVDRRPAGPFRHFGAYLVAAKGGIVSNVPGWARTQPWVPVRLVQPLPSSPPPGYPQSYRPATHVGWEQLLIRDSDAGEPFDYLRGLPNAELLRWRGRWRLYRTQVR